MPTPSPDVLALLEATFDAVVIMDDRGRIQAFNASAEEMFGYRAADALGRNVNMLMTATDRLGHDDHLKRYLAGGEARVLGKGRDVRVRHRDGSEFSVFLSRRPHPEHRSTPVRRLSARHLAAPQGAGNAGKGAAAQPPLPGSGAGHAGRHRSQRHRPAGQPAGDPRAARGPRGTSSAAPGWTAASRREDRAIARAAFRALLHERRRRAAELRIPRARPGRRGPVHHLARRRAARRQQRRDRHHALRRGHHRAAPRGERGPQGAGAHEQRLAPRDHGRDGGGHLARAQPAAGGHRQLLAGLRAHAAHAGPGHAGNQRRARADLGAGAAGRRDHPPHPLAGAQRGRAPRVAGHQRPDPRDARTARERRARARRPAGARPRRDRCPG